MNKAYLMQDLIKEGSQTKSSSIHHHNIKPNLCVLTKKKELSDRRKHIRFQVRETAFVVLKAPWPHSTKVGQIIDISMHGLAFRYIADEGRSNGSSELEILSADHSFYLDRVPFKTISDFKTDNDVPFSSIEMRRSGVQFGDLTPSQSSQLEHFIWNYTTSEE
jgi:hypothetical protein